MKLMTLKQYMKMSKKALIRKITKTLRTMPKKKLAMACYNITKSKLPRLRTNSSPMITTVRAQQRLKKKKSNEEIPRTAKQKAATKKLIAWNKANR